MRASHLAETTALRHARRIGWREKGLSALQQAAEIRRGDDLRDEAIACLAAPDLESVSSWSTQGHVLGTDAEGLRVATGHNDGEVKLAPLAGGPANQSFPGWGSACLTAHFSPSGRHMVVLYRVDSDAQHEDEGATEPELELGMWDTDEARLLFRAPLVPISVASSCFDADERRVAICLRESVHVLEVESGRELARFQGPGRVMSADFDQRGERLAIARYSPHSIELVSIADELSLQGRTLAALPHDALWLNDGRLAIASADFRIYLWDVDGETEADERSGVVAAQAVITSADPEEQPATPLGVDPHVTLLQGHRSEVTRLMQAPESPLLVSYGWDAQSILWNTVTDEPLLRTAGQVVGVRSDGAHFIMRSAAEISVWRLTWGEVYDTIYAHSGKSPSTVDASLDGRWLASGGHDGAILWHLPDKRRVATLTETDVNEVVFDPQGERLYTSGAQGVIAWELPSGEWTASDPTTLHSSQLTDRVMRRAGDLAPRFAGGWRPRREQCARVSPRHTQRRH